MSTDDLRAAALRDAARNAGERIAPTWPLDQLIAVNPWWEMRDQSLSAVSARLAALGQVECLMPRNWYRAHWQREIRFEHLAATAAESGVDLDEKALLAWLDGGDQLAHWHNFSDQVDGTRDLERQVSWHDEIVHQISQFCASFFSGDTPLPAVPGAGLYGAWLDAVRNDRGIEIMMGERGLHRQFEALPDDEDALFQAAAEAFELGAELAEDYFHALLLEVNGWASWVAYLRWQANLAGGEDDRMPSLLAVRLAWELVLWRHHAEQHAETAAIVRRQWRQQFERLPELLRQHRDAQRPAWTWQRAAELAFQGSLHDSLLAPVPAAAAVARPSLQAVFCIDVRSEVYRRALEDQDPSIQTLGFAGFFGLPIAYAPAGSAYERPQLPGLLPSAITVVEAEDADRVKARSQGLNRRARWEAVGKKAPAAFGFVEAAGIGYALRLLRESFAGADPVHPVNELCGHGGRFELRQDGAALDAAAQAGLVAGVLGAMTLTDRFAPVVLLAGHGSSTRNNPHAAGLDCGACCGQTGEVNVRVLAQVLNDSEVRAHLAADHGITIPGDTRFLPTLHDTTTDELKLLEALPDTGAPLADWIAAASAATRRERAPALGVSPARSDRALPARSRDWSQVRPEWGLAGNACFIVAPRSRSRHLDLGGRSFLHDYDWRADAENGYPVLELIMTAPMVVTHWINMQYNASVTDPSRYGSGNKVLHNVVGGNLGVFEGNGGDLRIGLPLQSVHDGEDWVHPPLRLSVYLDAPAEAIAAIADKHEVVRQLIDNEWLYLFRLDDEAGEIQRLYRGRWSVAASSEASAAA
ncbi:MAG: YbcC family protein [Pseudohaliea sp.]